MSQTKLSSEEWLTIYEGLTRACLFEISQGRDGKEFSALREKIGGQINAYDELEGASSYIN